MRLHKISLLCGAMFACSMPVFAETIKNPCHDQSFLTYLDRPNKADSVCAAPVKSVIYEMGYQYLQLTGTGHAQNFPQAEFRVGLPADTELFLLSPTYNLQTVAPHAGFAETTVGIKHMFGYTEKTIWAAEAEVTPASGSAAFGSNGTGWIVNGLFSYSMTDSLAATFELGASSQTLPTIAGGGRYNSINPDAVIAWSVTSKVNLYGELFGQSKTAPTQHAGMNFDGGIIYLLTPHVSIDAEIGQRVFGQLGGYNNYVGCGLGWMIT